MPADPALEWLRIFLEQPDLQIVINPVAKRGAAASPKIQPLPAAQDAQALSAAAPGPQPVAAETATTHAAAPTAAKQAPEALPRMSDIDCKSATKSLDGQDRFYVCVSHGHIIDSTNGMIVAADLEDFEAKSEQIAEEDRIKKGSIERYAKDGKPMIEKLKFFAGGLIHTVMIYPTDFASVVAAAKLSEAAVFRACEAMVAKWVPMAREVLADVEVLENMHPEDPERWTAIGTKGLKSASKEIPEYVNDFTKDPVMSFLHQTKATAGVDPASAKKADDLIVKYEKVRELLLYYLEGLKLNVDDYLNLLNHLFADSIAHRRDEKDRMQRWRS